MMIRLLLTYLEDIYFYIQGVMEITHGSEISKIDN